MIEHVFTPPAGQPWERCVICHLSEAQHLTTGAIYAPDLPYRCPHCVTVDTAICTHRDDPIGVNAKPLSAERESA